MKTNQKKNWRRRLGSTLICLCLIWLIYVVAMNFMAWHFSKEMGQAHRNLDVVPTPLMDTSVAELSGSRVDKFGFSFQIPWRVLERDQTTKSIAVMSFSDGSGLLIFDPAAEPNGVKIMRGTTARQQKLMSDVLGSRTLSSNYELMASEVLSTPAEVKWWATRAQNTRAGILLTNKSLNMHDATVIHKIGSATVRGFQYGDPNILPFLVQIDLFDRADNHYKLIISGKGQNRPVISQAQINALVCSFRTLPPRMENSSSTNGD